MIRGIFAKSAIVCAAMAVGFAASPVLAKTKGNTTAEDRIVADAGKFCLEIVREENKVGDELKSDGWELDSPYGRTFYDEASASRIYEPGGTAYIWSFREQYPNHVITYCSFDMNDGEIDFDIAKIGEDPALSGHVEQDESGEYGSWQMPGEDYLTLVHAFQDDEGFRYQITRIVDLKN